MKETLFCLAIIAVMFFILFSVGMYKFDQNLRYEQERIERGGRP